MILYDASIIFFFLEEEEYLLYRNCSKINLIHEEEYLRIFHQ